MKIKELKGTDENDSASYELRVNDKYRLSAYPLCECPEDATLERDLGFVYSIVPLMREAYESGKNGEEFIVEQGEIND